MGFEPWETDRPIELEAREGEEAQEPPEAEEAPETQGEQGA